MRLEGKTGGSLGYWTWRRVPGSDPDHGFHVGEWYPGGVSDRGLRGVSDGECGRGRDHLSYIPGMKWGVWESS